MSTAFSCCLCFVLSLACNDKPQVTYNISEQRNTQLAVLCTGRAQFHEHKWWATRGSKEKTHIFIYLKYRLSRMCTHLFPVFFLLRDDQFTSVGFQSTIVLYTQEHSNTLCWGIKTKQNKTNTRENYHSTEIKTQSRSSSVFSSTLW